MKRFRSAGLPIYVLALGFCAAGACTAQDPETTAAETKGQQAASPAIALSGPVSGRFGDFWYQGKAELTSYDLEQARYGEIHPGHAVLIFVTEDFSRSKQVKLDDPAAAGEDAVKVLKLNATRKFNTGIYPYSMMTSVFTPVYRSSDPRTLKVTTTSQEWCGHTFSQINRKNAGYELQAFSYFESEGDVTRSIPDVLLEDEIWTAIRLDPRDLPTGEIEILPGTLIQRLRHAEWSVQTATTTLQAADGKPGLSVYRVEYPGRTLAIEFQDAFPHEIQGWEDTYQSGWGGGAKQLTTRATLKKRIWLDYWSKHGPEDSTYRKQMGLD
jgi:hypothetical protein